MNHLIKTHHYIYGRTLMLKGGKNENIMTFYD